MSSEFAVWLGLVTGLAAVAIWTIVFVRSVLDWSRRDERRVTWLVMAGTALLAAIGTLASSIGFGMQVGVIHLDIPQFLFSFIASVGRGALLMAGLIVLTHARPPKVSK
jgi:hypothetical protein